MVAAGLGVIVVAAGTSVAVGSLTCLVLSPTQPSAFAGRGRGTCPTGRRLHSSPTAGNVGSGVLSSDVSGQVMR